MLHQRAQKGRRCVLVHHVGRVGDFCESFGMEKIVQVSSLLRRNKGVAHPPSRMDVEISLSIARLHVFDIADVVLGDLAIKRGLSRRIRPGCEIGPLCPTPQPHTTSRV